MTVPRVGYRLVAPRRRRARARRGAAARRAALRRPRRRPGAGLVRRRVVEDIIAALGRFRSFAVVARSSSFAYRDAPPTSARSRRELGVRYVLEGSVRRAGERLRITAELVDGETGTQLWAETFDGALAEVFDFQDRITEAVATVAEPRIQAAEIARSRRERPGSVATYDIYLRALAGIRVRDRGGKRRGLCARRPRGWQREPDNPRCWRSPPGRSSIAPPWAGRLSGPTTARRCADFARRGLERAGGDADAPRPLRHLAAAGRARVRLGHGRAAARRSRPIRTTSCVLVHAAVGHLHCGDLDEALALARAPTGCSAGRPRGALPARA